MLGRPTNVFIRRSEQMWIAVQKKPREVAWLATVVFSLCVAGGALTVAPLWRRNVARRRLGVGGDCREAGELSLSLSDPPTNSSQRVSHSLLPRP